MALAAGTRLGPYELIAPIGAGGMGEVYRTTDTRLHREVAIKVSAERFSERFEREARVIAALNHPNICTLYDVGHNYLVMELVEGPTLAERIKEGAIPLVEALAIARQITDALDAAHEKGIVHRDLKPGNIKLKPDGTVKVLDFGLAKVGGTPTAKGEDSPTISMAATQAGVILGTAGYMSPEQARGQMVDQRADIWAFGIVLYEMLTGERVFRGETITDVLAAVVKEQPEWDLVPFKVRRLVRKCLEKDPRRRLRSIADAWELLDEDALAQVATLPVRRTKLPWVAAGVATVIAIALPLGLWAPWRAAPEPPKPALFQIAPPPGVTVGLNFSLSPDGTKLAYIAWRANGVNHIWVRAMDTLESRELAGTEGVGNVPLFWSPDSRFVVFEAEGKLKKVEVSGGPLQTICEVSATVIGGSWNRDGVILFGVNSGEAIQRVSSAGGAPSAVTPMNASRKDVYDAFPVFLPDGRHFLYFVDSAVPGNTGIYLGSLDSKPGQPLPQRLVATNFGAGFVPLPNGKGGEILFQREGTLLARRFDLRRLELAGEAIPVAEQLGRYISFGYFSASDNGILVYRGMAVGGTTQLGWFDRQGKSLGVVGLPHSYAATLAISPDGTKVAASRNDGGNWDIWLTPFSRASDTRFTFDPAVDAMPVWSPDGHRIAFSSVRSGVSTCINMLRTAQGTKICC